MTAKSATLTWAVPRDDGGSPITAYVLEMKKPRDYKWTEISSTVSDTRYTVDGLKEETEYIFRVSAVNKAGQSKPSSPSELARYGE